jgi:hypothetical protein
MRTVRHPQVIAMRVNSDGSIATANVDGISVQGTANYIITFPPGFRLISATANPASGGGTFTTTLSNWTDRSVTVTMVSGGTAAAQSFALIAVGSEV